MPLNAEKTSSYRLTPPPFDSPVRSCERLLEWSAPLLNEEELLRSRADVSSFLSNEAPLLQEELERLRKADGEGILGSVPYWEDWYLSYREALPVHANPFYIFDPEALPGFPIPFPWSSTAPRSFARSSKMRKSMRNGSPQTGSRRFSGFLASDGRQ